MPLFPRNSLLVWRSGEDGPGDTPATILPPLIERLRAASSQPAEPRSMADSSDRRAAWPAVAGRWAK